MSKGRGFWSKAISDDVYKDRLWSRCEIQPNGCWVYLGPKATNGYGFMCYRNRSWRAHRLAYFLWKGEIPKGADVCHTCDVRLCCNPEHLWVGTRSENMLDASYKRKWPHQASPTCKHGHPFSGDNLKIMYGRQQKCRACARIRQRIKAGWPPELARTLPPTPRGKRPVNAPYTRVYAGKGEGPVHG